MGDAAPATSAEVKVKAVLDALTTLPAFDYNAYESGIQNLLGVDSNSWSNVCSRDLYGETPTLGDVSNVVQRFKVQTIALGVSRNSQFGFADTVIMDGFQDRLTSTSSAIVVPVYRTHLEQHMAANGAPFSVANLAQDMEFCMAFFSEVLTSDFINDALIARFFDQPGYTEAIAFLYERLRGSLSNAATFRDTVTDSSALVSTVSANSLPSIPVFSQTAMASQSLKDAGRTQDFMATALPLVWSDNKLLQGPMFPTLGVAWANLWMANTYTTGVIGNLINSDEIRRYSPGSYTTGSHWITYGDKLWQWIVSQQANGYGDVFNVTQPENSKFDNPLGIGCFAPGTVVATANGDVAIEDLRPSTMVMTKAPGHYGRSSSERVEHPTVMAQPGHQHLVVPLYGFNGEEPFATGGHIFFTAAGPRAINPAAAKAENSSVKVGQLHEGDVLLRLNHDRSGYDKVRIETITCRGAKRSTIHGVHLEKGSHGGHKYHANGYWVGENYPQLTIKGLLDNYHKMTLADQKAFVKHVSNLPPSFRHVLGPGVFDTVQRFFSTIGTPTHLNSESIQMKQYKDPSTILDAVEEAGRHHISIMSVVAHYKLINHDELRKSQTVLDTTDPEHAGVIADLNRESVLPEVSMCHGAVVIHGHQACPALASHASMSHLAAQWSIPLEGQPGMYQHGVLRSVYHGRAALGYVATGPAEVRSLEEFSSITPVMAVASANTYNVNFSTKVFASSTEATSAKAGEADGWSPFWKVVIGLVHDTSGGFKVSLTLPDLDKQWLNTWGKSPNAAGLLPYQVLTPKLNQKTYVMTIGVQVCPGLEEGPPGLLDTLQNWNLKDDKGNPIPAGPAFNQFWVDLNLMTNELHGYTCDLASDGATGNFKDGSIHGLTTSGSNTVSHIRTTVNDLVENTPSMPGSFESADVHHSPANFHAPAHQAAQMLATKLFTAGDLSIGDLQTTAAPSDTDLNKASQQYMQNAGNYWRLKGESDVFGNDKDAMKTALPASGSLTDQLYSEGQAWLGTYNRGLMLQALQRDSRYVGNFTEAERSKLAYYWQGGQAGCLSSNTHFNRISEVCAREAFLALTPGLKPYIEDSRDWANLFYAFVTSDEQLNLQVFGMSLDPGASNLTNKYCMILNALDWQNRGYDTTLWDLVKQKVLCSLSNGTIKGDEKETPLFLESLVAELIRQIQTDPSSALLAQLKVDFENLKNHWDTDSAEEIAARLLSEQYELGKCFLEAAKDLDFIISQKGMSKFSQLMDKWEQWVRQEYPNQAESLIKGLRYGYAILGLAMDAYGVLSSVKYLQDWGNLDTAQKAEAVISMVQFVVQTGTDLVGLIEMISGKEPGSFDFKIGCVKWNKAIGEVGGHTVTKNGVDADGQIMVDPALPEENLRNITIAQTGSPESSVEKALAKAATGEKVAEGIEKEFSVTESVACVIAIAANVAAAVCMGYQIKDDFKNGESPAIESLDILSEIATCLQVIHGMVQMGAMVMGVQSIAIPIAGLVIAIVGIIFMFCEMFIPHKAPPDPVKTYIEDNKASFLEKVPPPPAVALTYNLLKEQGGNTIEKGKYGTVVLSVNNTANVDIKFRSLSLRMPVGLDADELFVPPDGKDPTTGKSPINNLVFYELMGNPDGWSVQGAPVANSTDGTMMAKIISTSKDDKGSLIPAGGLTLTITGRVNDVAGVVTFRVIEAAVSRPGADDIPAGDYTTSLEMRKS